MVRNGALIYVAHPDTGIDPAVHTRYTESDIDLDSVPLNGGVLLRTLSLSSDPYIRWRMRKPHIQSFVPPIHIADPYVCNYSAILTRIN